jgi:hypothetical protein
VPGGIQRIDARRPVNGHKKYHCRPPKCRGSATKSIRWSDDRRSTRIQPRIALGKQQISKYIVLAPFELRESKQITRSTGLRCEID